MKTNYLFFTCFVCGVLALNSCSSDTGIAENTTKDENATSVKLVVPTGCQSLVIKYIKSSGSVDSVTTAIKPVANVVSGRDVSSLTNVTLTINSQNNAYVDIYDNNKNLLAQNLYIAAVSTTTSKSTRADDITASVTLPEDAVAKYVTADGPFTFYHSSGVAMFDDSWPDTPVVGSVDADFNDVVIDYDIEAKTVDAVQAPSETYRECIKVVMHVRAIGGTYPTGAGLLLEGFDSKYIDSYEKKITLGNYNVNIPSNSLSTTVDTSGDHPKILINNLGWLSSSTARSTYYTNSKTGASQLINTNVASADQVAKYGTDKTGQRYYNVNKGYINAGGDLFTITVTFYFKDRTSMSTTNSAAQLANMINTVTNTESQNFYMVTNKGYEIHMKGYQPTASYTAYSKDAASGNATMDSSTPYSTSDGLVWGFKTPVLTKHVWEKQSFYKAYVHYKDFLANKGTSYKDWYINNSTNVPDNTTIVCWW